MEINEKRLVEEFLELTSIDAVSFRERQMADLLTKKLREIGFVVTEDDAGERLGGNAGNLFATLGGDLPGTPILFVGHMDTVAPGIGKQSKLTEDGTIVSNRKTVLGGDDVTALVEILEGIRAVRAQKKPHRDIEILFPIAEEPYCKGSGAFDFSGVRAKEAYVLDMTGPVGTAVTKAPTILSFRAQIIGRSAHAGFEPEKGIHAIRIMSRVISRLKLGRVDEETTLNIGTIQGGTNTNSVPKLCSVEGEIRSFDHKKAMDVLQNVRDVFEEEIKETEATLQFEHVVHITAYEIDKEETVVRRFQGAAEALGLDAALTNTFGGSDNNVLNQNGIKGVVLSCGMYNAHTTEEYTTVQDLATGAELVAELITQA